MDKYALIERFYDVPAREGAKVLFNGRRGMVVGACGNYLDVEFQDGNRRMCHPGGLVWLEDGGDDVDRVDPVGGEVLG